jgi:hypothetical protein
MEHPLTTTQRLQIALDEFRPSRHKFFPMLKGASESLIRSPEFLDSLYVRYQAAMHATRVMVYFLPFLDEIEFRTRKCEIIAEDDNLPGGDTHHEQLRRTWTTLLGRKPSAADSYFGSLDVLAKALDQETGRFVEFVYREYPKTLGPWVMVEGLAHNWIEALCDSLTPHFPNIANTDYFVGNLTSGVELEHADVALVLFEQVIARNPQIVEASVEAAIETGSQLNRFWDGCCKLIQ